MPKATPPLGTTWCHLLGGRCHLPGGWGHSGTHPLGDEGAEARQHLVEPGVGGDALEGLLVGWGHGGRHLWGHPGRQGTPQEPINTSGEEDGGATRAGGGRGGGDATKGKGGWGQQGVWGCHLRGGWGQLGDTHGTFGLAGAHARLCDLFVVELLLHRELMDAAGFEAQRCPLQERTFLLLP